MFARVEVALRPEYPDPGAQSCLRKIELAHPELRRQIRWARFLDVFWLDVDVPREQLIQVISEVFRDRVLHWLFTGDLLPSAAGPHGNTLDLMERAPERPGSFWGLERRFRPGVTDNVGRTTLEAFEIVLGRKVKGARASSGGLLLLEGPEITDEGLSSIARDVFCNELIESWTGYSQDELLRIGRFHPERVRRDLPKVSMRSAANVEPVRLEGLEDAALEELSRKRLWALSATEMRAIRDHFAEPSRRARRQTSFGLAAPTDVELEVLAQTWSEHCKHKIFAASIKYKEPSERPAYQGLIPDTVNGLFKQAIAGATEQLRRDWLLSVFHDNAGIIAFDDNLAVCIKVETHNSPSALDPYGGALTGIVGVNRDILGCGRGAKPVFNTDVFCLAPPDYSQSLPERILHPRRILDGVRLGVEHGGNKSGIPTINGALVFDNRFLGKPLIYCGTAGVMPRESAGMRCESKEIRPGDRVCMVGGRIGKDGIHGATFSSLALDETSPATAVQLGDPITQKRTADFLLEARDLGLFRTLTDNGAGGLSSSVGELAERSGGARIDVAKARTKYPGLKPYELVISESQERMTMAVPSDKLELFLALAERRGVEVSDLGEFTDGGIFEIQHEGKCVAALELEFLHGGCPRLSLEAEWQADPAGAGSVELGFGSEAPKRLLAVLGRPNVASKEWLIRQYDHEVQGASVVKPLHTVGAGTPNAASGPNDAGVVKISGSGWGGLAVGCGINPKLSDIDPYLMAQAAVDEAARNVLCVGAEYGGEDSVFAMVDNFCWPDPLGDPLKTAALVRAGYGMREAVLALGIPIVSGKDSMKNDYRGRREGKPIVISVPPTLLMTAIARVPDVRQARTSDFKRPGDLIYLVGPGSFGLLGSELHSMHVDQLRSRGGNERQVVLPSASGNSPSVGAPDWEVARRVFGWMGGAYGRRQRLLRSAHDVSEGGLLVALAEGLIARGLGASIELPAKTDPWEISFGEGFHSFVVSLREVDGVKAENEWRELGVPFTRLGQITAEARLKVAWGTGKGYFAVPTIELRQAWNREGYWE